MTAPTLLLTCQVCGWVPYEDQTVEDTAQHFAEEHEDAPVAMMLMSYCPKDGAPLQHRFTGVTKAGRNASTYDCPSCKRTFHVKWGGNDL